MKDPKVLLGLNISGERVSLTMNRSDGGGRPTWVNWELEKVESGGYLAFCQRVGEIGLRMLASAHPAEFAKHPLLVPPRTQPTIPTASSRL